MFRSPPLPVLMLCLLLTCAAVFSLKFLLGLLLWDHQDTCLSGKRQQQGVDSLDFLYLDWCGILLDNLNESRIHDHCFGEDNHPRCVCMKHGIYLIVHVPGGDDCCLPATQKRKQTSSDEKIKSTSGIFFQVCNLLSAGRHKNYDVDLCGPLTEQSCFILLLAYCDRCVECLSLCRTT